MFSNILADEISKLSVQCEEWRSTLDTVQEARAQDRLHSQQLIATKVHTLFCDYIFVKHIYTCHLALYSHVALSHFKMKHIQYMKTSSAPSAIGAL